MLIKTVSLLLLYSQVSMAADWSSTHISYLYGKGYKTPVDSSLEVDHSIFTFEHASGWKYGDNFFFTDALKTGTVSSELYMEWEPRLSSSKIFGITYDGFINDVLLAAQLNVTPSAPRTQLFGAGLNLALPHFNLFQIGIYLRDDRAIESSTYQLTFVWDLPFSLIDQQFVFSGYLDIAGKEGSGSESNILTQPQLLWKPLKDLGVGLEYQYWKNKFGIKDLNESTPQFILKWTL